MSWQPPAAVLLVIAAGYPLALLVTRRYLLAAVVAPLVTGVTAALAVVAMLVVGGDLLLWLATLLIAQYALVAWRLRRPGTPMPHATWVDVLCVVLPLLPAAALVFSPAVLWDSHSIWWTHAAYFAQGGAFARRDMADFAYYNSHPDYPPLASAVVAGAWRVLPGYSFTVAQFVSTTLTVSAVCTLGCAVRQVTGRAPVAVSRLAAVVVALAAWGTAPYAVASGYSDQLWAAALVAGATLLLLGERPLARPALPVLLLAVAGLTKNEALLPVLVVAALASLRGRRELRRAWPVWLPAVAGVGWVLLARALGAKSDVAANTGIGGIGRVASDSVVLDRVPATLHGLWSMVGLLVAAALAVALLGWAGLRRERRALRLGSDLWLWAVAVPYTASLVFIYATSTSVGLSWYLSTSLDRVTVPVELLAILSVVCWAAALVVRLRGGVPAEDGQADAGRPAEPAPELGDGLSSRSGWGSPAPSAARS